MKITKFVHSCLLVEMPEPVSRTALFDPGVMSEEALDVDSLEFLDDIFITHGHPDHLSMKLMKKLVTKFPKVRVTTTPQVAEHLKGERIEVGTETAEGVSFFEAPHEGVKPLFHPIENTGIHYLNLLTDPGDSHTFGETNPILALPVTAPWGSTATAVSLALELKPKYIIPIHDWHWRSEARVQMYDRLEQVFREQGIKFFKLKTGEPIVTEV